VFPRLGFALHNSGIEKLFGCEVFEALVVTKPPATNKLAVETASQPIYLRDVSIRPLLIRARADPWCRAWCMRFNRMSEEVAALN
jgi:hypothetical protein